jgi:uncharacterized protein YbjT (DUF2867 family)
LQQNFLGLANDFKGAMGTVSMPIGKGAFAPVHARDIALAAKNILYNVHEHEGRVYKLTGPELLTGVEIAGKAARGLNKPIKFSNTVSKNLHEGRSNWARTLDLELYAVIASGFFISLSPDFHRLVGRKGITLQEFFQEHSELFQGNASPVQARL